MFIQKGDLHHICSSKRGTYNKYVYPIRGLTTNMFIQKGDLHQICYIKYVHPIRGLALNILIQKEDL